MKHYDKPRKIEFLTIPDAPAYEINGFFQVRNKATGLILSTRKRHGRPTADVSLYYKNKRIIRSVKSFYQQALMNVVSPGGWFPVHSLQDRYEINAFGEARNARTKKLLRPICDRKYVRYCFHQKGKTVSILKGKLIEEVFGVPYIKKKAPVAVILRNGASAYHFKSSAAAARFLSSKVFFGVITIQMHMVKREPEIFGWQVQYLG